LAGDAAQEVPLIDDLEIFRRDVADSVVTGFKRWGGDAADGAGEFLSRGASLEETQSAP